MKRRKASAKMSHVVHSGWMIKSPPDRKLHSAFKIFRSQWKKRFFVLRKPSGSLPDQYELHYYKDERCSTKKGSIDLEQCEQIIEALDSEIFPFLLAIKTYYKNKVRTYYLAVETELEMNTWVQWLCLVCGLKPEDQHIPEAKPAQTLSTTKAGNPTSGTLIGNGISPSPQRPASPAEGATASPLSASPQPAGGFLSASPTPVTRVASESSLCYIPLEKCTTGQPQPVDRRESVESVPDFEAPAPPQKLHHSGLLNGGVTLEDDVFGPGLYDHPPVKRLSEVSSVSRDSDLYKVPPSRPLRSKKSTIDDSSLDSSYDVPPPRIHSPRSSLSVHTHSLVSSGSSDRESTLTECYDYPPRREPQPPTDSDMPPARPPKPGHMHASSPYQNLPPAGQVPSDISLMNTVPAPPKFHTVRQSPGYDIPPSSGRHLSRTLQPGSAQAIVVPPRPNRYVPSNPSHTYLNTHSKPGSIEAHLSPKPTADIEAASDDLKLTVPSIASPRNELAGETSDACSSSSSLYQIPPPSLVPASGTPMRPPVRAHPPSVSPHSHESNTFSNQSQEDSAASIFSSQRTRSFKRNNGSSNNNNNTSPKVSPKLNSTPMTSLVPAPRPVPPSRPKEMPSASDEDEEARLHDQEEQTHHPLSLLRAVPPPAETDKSDRELKYIDLALPESSQEPPRMSYSHGHVHSYSHNHLDRGKESATEYREIDFIKTQALSDTKRVKESQREMNTPDGRLDRKNANN